MSLTKIGSIGINTGIAFAGVTTIATLNGSDAVLSVGGTVNFVSDVSIGGTVSIAGTLTYEDVTNVDAVGLITARNGIVVGSGITLSKDGDGFFTGVVTATSYAGDGSALTGIDATQIATLNTSVQTTDTGSDGTVKVNTDGSERVRITSGGNVNIGGNYDETSHPLNVSDSTKPSLALHTGTALRADLSATSGVTSIRSYSNSPFTINIGGSGETEALRIDGSGRLLLGTTTEGESSADNLTIADSGNTGITIRSGTTNYGLVYFSDATSGTGEYDGAIEYKHDDNFMVFRTGASERLRIGSAGQLGIGGANYGTSGQVLRSQGSSSAIEWATPSGWVFGTAADYDQWTSVTDISLSGWPTNWKQIRINFVDISSNANAYIQYFVSKSSDTNSRIASGYQTQSGHFGASQSVDSVTNMGRFSGTASSSYSMTGYVNFHKFNGAIIRYEGQLSEDGNTYIYITNGHVECDPTDDMSHIFFRCQGYSYDSGKFSIDYLV